MGLRIIRYLSSCPAEVLFLRAYPHPKLLSLEAYIGNPSKSRHCPGAKQLTTKKIELHNEDAAFLGQISMYKIRNE